MEKKKIQGCVGSGEREGKQPHTQGWDLGFLQNPKIPTKLSRDFTQKSQTGDFYPNRKTGNSRIWERLQVLDPLPKNPGVFSIGFPFPDDFSKQIFIFF